MRNNAVGNTKDLIYEWITAGTDAYMKQVDEIIAAKGWAALNDLASRVHIAVDPTRGNKLAAFHVLQLFPHCEPLWVDPDYLGAGLADIMADKMLHFMMDEIQARGFMVIADSPHAVKLCEERGMRRITSPVYVI